MTKKHLVYFSITLLFNVSHACAQQVNSASADKDSATLNVDISALKDYVENNYVQLSNSDGTVMLVPATFLTGLNGHDKMVPNRAGLLTGNSSVGNPYIQPNYVAQQKINQLENKVTKLESLLATHTQLLNEIVQKLGN